MNKQCFYFTLLTVSPMLVTGLINIVIIDRIIDRSDTSRIFILIN